MKTTLAEQDVGSAPGWMAMAVLFVLAVLPYVQTGWHPFTVMDDMDYVVENTVVREGFSAEGVRRAFCEAHASNWHPLTWLSHMVDVELFGLKAGGHHLVNACLHGVNAVLLFVALRLMTGAGWRSLLAAAIFALHPQRVESVAWVSERKDVLSGMFFMLTLLAYGWYAMRPGRGRYALVLGALACGLMAKSMLVTLPFLLLLLDVWPLGRKGWKRLVLEKVPLLALAIAASVVAMWSQHGESIASVSDVPVPVRMANALAVWVAYLGQMAWPFDLVPFYPYPTFIAGSDLFGELYRPGILAAALLLAMSWGVLWGTFFAKLKRAWLGVGWFWYVGTLVPVIGFVQVGIQSRADRYTYLPMIGIGIILAWGAGELASRSKGWRNGVTAGAAALLAGWLGLSWVQTTYWRSDERLFGRTVEVDSRAYFAHLQLGGLAHRRKDYEDAVRHYRDALEVYPSYVTAHFNMGNVLMELEQYAAAEEHFLKGLALRGRRKRDLQSVALLYKRQQRWEESAGWMGEALQMDEDDIATLLELGRLYGEMGRFEEAAAYLDRVLEMDPDNSYAINDLGVIELRLGNREKAIALMERALELNPENETARKNLEVLRGEE